MVLGKRSGGYGSEVDEKLDSFYEVSINFNKSQTEIMLSDKEIISQTLSGKLS